MTARLHLWIAVGIALVGCNESGKPSAAKPDAGPPRDAGKALTLEQMKNPESCKECHPKHYREWSASMHAYAAADPVFLAMNRRGQRETNGELGKFCIQCHAPMAVRELPFDTDWSKVDPEELEEHQKGVTCYFCHNAVGVNQHFNGDVWLANDTTMRAGIMDPKQPKAHKAKGSIHHDRQDISSSKLCGSCHDIVTPPPKSVELERTFQEYSGSFFSKTLPNSTKLVDNALSCIGCHMDADKIRGTAAEDTNTAVLPLRDLHSHLFPAVDIALTKFPHPEAMRSAVEDCELRTSLALVLLETKSFAPGFMLDMRLTIESMAGHNQPSGASQDRTMWVEVVAYDDADNVVYEASGNPTDKSAAKANLRMQDHLLDESGAEVHMFWEAAEVDIDSTPTLPAPNLNGGPHGLYPEINLSSAVIGKSRPPERITVTIRMKPMNDDVLQSLVDSGDLDPAIMDAMPTYTVYSGEATLEDADSASYSDLVESTVADCATYKCLLDPDSCPK
jgi:hypothetical protein